MPKGDKAKHGLILKPTISHLGERASCFGEREKRGEKEEEEEEEKRRKRRKEWMYGLLWMYGF